MITDVVQAYRIGTLDAMEETLGMAEKRRRRKNVDDNDPEYEPVQDAKRTRLWAMYNETKELVKMTKPFLEVGNRSQGEPQKDHNMTPTVCGQHCDKAVDMSGDSVSIVLTCLQNVIHGYFFIECYYSIPFYVITKYFVCEQSHF